MKILLSPSKTKKLKGVYDNNYFPEKTQRILNILKELSVETLQEKMKIKKEKAEFLRFLYNTADNKKGAAILSYTGQVFKKFDIQENDYEYVKKHIYILSAMYGILEAFQGIIEYRLDLDDGIIDKNYWKKEVNEILEKEDEILNLASREYTKQIDKSMYNVIFLSKGQIKIKRAELLRKIVDKKIDSIKGLFELEGFNRIEEKNIYFE